MARHVGRRLPCLGGRLHTQRPCRGCDQEGSHEAVGHHARLPLPCAADAHHRRRMAAPRTPGRGGNRAGHGATGAHRRHGVHRADHVARLQCRRTRNAGGARPGNALTRSVLRGHPQGHGRDAALSGGATSDGPALASRAGGPPCQQHRRRRAPIGDPGRPPRLLRDDRTTSAAGAVRRRRTRPPDGSARGRRGLRRALGMATGDRP